MSHFPSYSNLCRKKGLPPPSGLASYEVPPANGKLPGNPHELTRAKPPRTPLARCYPVLKNEVWYFVLDGNVFLAAFPEKILAEAYVGIRSFEGQHWQIVPRILTAKDVWLTRAS